MTTHPGQQPTKSFGSPINSLFVTGRWFDRVGASILLAAQQLGWHSQKREQELTCINQALTALVADNKQLIAQLENTIHQQQQVIESKSRLGIMISHELRTPLSLILNSSELLRNFSDQLSEEQKQHYFDIICRHIDQLVKLLDDLMALAKAEIVSDPQTQGICNIETFCRDLVSTFQSAHVSTHTIQFQCSSHLTEAAVDPTILHHIVTNLVSNAVKYSPAGGEITITLSSETNAFVLQVQDHGVGIAEEDISQLFDLFYRGSNADVAEGTGVGLVIVKQSVEALDGTIQVDSKLGTGTTFVVRFPQSKESRY